MNTMITAHTTYDDIAAEYYDAVRHPTCANFLELSAAFLVPRIQKHAPTAKNILEVGAGRSLVAPIMAAKNLPLSHVTLLDQSPRMLEHSREWEPRGARLLVSDATSTGLPPASFKLIVSSLGDPYNDANFWEEVSRLLDSKGVCLFTTPAREWSERFRAGSNRRAAEFLLANGATVSVRSDILSMASQSEIIDGVGIYLDEMQALDAAQLSGPLSSKLLVDGQTSSLPVVRGFAIRKR
jgi:SAM-dependent methyltransferase